MAVLLSPHCAMGLLEAPFHMVRATHGALEDQEEQEEPGQYQVQWEHGEQGSSQYPECPTATISTTTVLGSSWHHHWMLGSSWHHHWICQFLKQDHAWEALHMGWEMNLARMSRGHPAPADPRQRPDPRQRLLLLLLWWLWWGATILLHTSGKLQAPPCLSFLWPQLPGSCVSIHSLV